MARVSDPGRILSRSRRGVHRGAAIHSYPREERSFLHAESRGQRAPGPGRAGHADGRAVAPLLAAGAASTELPERDGAPVRVRLLGEDLVAFRDSNGKVGLVDAYLPASPRAAVLRPQRRMRPALRLSRLEIRRRRRLRRHAVGAGRRPIKTRSRSRPIRRSSAAAWSGPISDRPTRCRRAPDYELMRAPETHRARLEDLSRTATVCRRSKAGSIPRMSRSCTTTTSATSTISSPRDGAPQIEVRARPIRLLLRRRRADRRRGQLRARLSLRHAGPADARPTSRRRAGRTATVPRYDGHIWVPIDDEHTWSTTGSAATTTICARSRTMSTSSRRFMAAAATTTSPARFAEGERRNDYLIDRALQKTTSFTGIRASTPRTWRCRRAWGRSSTAAQEHLGTSDRAIVAPAPAAARGDPRGRARRDAARRRSAAIATSPA